MQILDNLIAQGKAQPMIVVMPNGNMSDDAAPGYGVKGQVRPSIPEEHRMDGLFEEAFLEIIRFVDTHYRTIRSAKGRAIAGLSMGGYHSYWISLYYPQYFGNGSGSLHRHITAKHNQHQTYQSKQQQFPYRFSLFLFRLHP